MDLNWVFSFPRDSVLNETFVFEPNKKHHFVIRIFQVMDKQTSKIVSKQIFCELIILCGKNVMVGRKWKNILRIHKPWLFKSKRQFAQTNARQSEYGFYTSTFWIFIRLSHVFLIVFTIPIKKQAHISNVWTHLETKRSIEAVQNVLPMVAYVSLNYALVCRILNQTPFLKKFSNVSVVAAHRTRLIGIHKRHTTELAQPFWALALA